MNIADLLKHKHTRTGPDVVTIAPADTVRTLIAALAEHNVGALVVVEKDASGAVLGIVSERDVVRRLADRGPDVLEARVADIMTSDVVSCGSSDGVDAVAEAMTSRRIRHMPVLDDGTLVGVVSIGDVVSSRIRQLEQDRGQLEQYISG